jgi:hypothetical protein
MFLLNSISISILIICFGILNAIVVASNRILLMSFAIKMESKKKIFLLTLGDRKCSI